MRSLFLPCRQPSSCCVFICWKERDLFHVSSYKGTKSIIRAWFSWPNYLPKTQSPNIITFGVKASIYLFWGTQFSPWTKWQGWKLPGLNNVNLLLLKMAWLMLMQCLICHQQRPKPNPWYGTILSEDQPANLWWQANYIGPHGWGQRFIFTGTDTFSGYGFPFPAHNACVSTTIYAFFYTALHLIQKLISQ